MLDTRYMKHWNPFSSFLSKVLLLLAHVLSKNKRHFRTINKRTYFKANSYCNYQSMYQIECTMQFYSEKQHFESAIYFLRRLQCSRLEILHVSGKEDYFFGIKWRNISSQGRKMSEPPQRIVSGVFTLFTLHFLRMAVKAILSSSSANLWPIQFLGPALNGI